VVLNVSAADLLNEPDEIGFVVASAVERAGPGLTGQWRITEVFRRSGRTDDLINSLAGPDPKTRAAAARLCGALRLTGSVAWIDDLVRDPDPAVKDAAIRALGQLGGRRSVEALMGAVDMIPMHRLAITLAQAATDIDIEALMRQPASEKAAVVTVLACGLRRDVLRVPPLLGIAHDKRWPIQVRIAACNSLGMIGDPSVVGSLDVLSEKDPNPNLKKAAARAWRRLQKTPPARLA